MVQIRGIRWKARRLRLARGLVLLLLAIIVTDLRNASCDPWGLLPLQAGLSCPAPVGGDACGDGCVPDCFCCSATFSAVSAIFVPAPAPVSEGPDLPVYSLSVGISPVPDHVPIDLR